MIKIFLSYRRSDSRHITERIYDRLVTQFGSEHVFKDLDSFPLGTDFRQALEEMVGQCHVLLLVIGERWLSLSDKSGARRLEAENDYVRTEIDIALRRGITIMPLLVDNIEMPKEIELPSSINKLAFYNGIQVRGDPDFHRDVDRVIKALLRVKEDATSPEELRERLLNHPKDIALRKRYLSVRTEALRRADTHLAEITNRWAAMIKGAALGVAAGGISGAIGGSAGNKALGASIAALILSMGFAIVFALVFLWGRFWYRRVLGIKQETLYWLMSASFIAVGAVIGAFCGSIGGAVGGHIAELIGSGTRAAVVGGLGSAVILAGVWGFIGVVLESDVDAQLFWAKLGPLPYRAYFSSIEIARMKYLGELPQPTNDGSQDGWLRDEFRPNDSFNRTRR